MCLQMEAGRFNVQLNNHRMWDCMERDMCHIRLDKKENGEQHRAGTLDIRRDNKIIMD